MPAAAIVTLISKAGCHLCDAARETVLQVVAENADASFEEKSIEYDPLLQEKYVEEIPVILINGRVHNIWRVDADRLRSALLEATA